MGPSAAEKVQDFARGIAIVGMIVLAYFVGATHGERQGRKAEHIACEAAQTGEVD